MSRAGPKFSDTQRETVYRLKCEGKSGRAISELCAAGVGDVPPFTISGQYANELAGRMKRERETLTITDLAKGPSSVAIGTLVQRMISIGEREIETLARDQRAGNLDARAFASVASSLKSLQQLSSKVPDKPREPDDAATHAPERESEEPEPRTFLGELMEDHERTAGDVRLPTSAIEEPAPQPEPRDEEPAPALEEPEPAAPTQPVTGVAAQIHQAAKVGTRVRARRAAHEVAKAERSEGHSSGSPSLDHEEDSRTSTHKGTGVDTETGIQGENEERELPEAVARVLARRAELSTS